VAKDRLRTQEAIDEGKEQQLRAGELKEQAEKHKEEVKQLETLISDLRGSEGDMASEGTAVALEAAESARDAERRKMQELHDERDKLLEKNQKMIGDVTRQKTRLQRSYANAQKVVERIELAEAKELVSFGIESGLKREMDDCAFAEALLEQAKARLDSLRF
jgi:hypothetical protein